MLNFISTQTIQYEAYTDRYLTFKVRFRKEFPRNKPTIQIGVSANQAINSIVELGKAWKSVAEAFTNYTKKLPNE
jgi:hypothetical protein